MRKFIGECLVFSIIPVIPLILFINVSPMHYNNKEYPMWLAKTEVMNSRTGYDSIIIGDSRAVAGIEPDILGPSWYNLALGGASPLEGYFVLKKVLAHGNKMTRMIVCYSPFLLEVDDTFFERGIKYDFYTRNDIDEVFFHMNMQKELFWKVAYDRLDTVSFYKYLFMGYLIKYKFPFFFRNELRNTLFYPRYAGNMETYRTIKRQRGCYMFGSAAYCDGLNYETERKIFRARKIIVKSLDDMFRMARDNGIEVFYQISPFNESSYRAVKASYRDGYYAFCDGMRKKHPEVHFSTGLFYYDNSFFGDPSHLNARGRRKWSTALKSYLDRFTQ